MQYALLIYESPMAFAARKNDDPDPYIGAWRAYYKAITEAGVYVGGDALEVPETATTVRLTNGTRHVQDGPCAETKEQLAGICVLELPSLDAALDWEIGRASRREREESRVVGGPVKKKKRRTE